MEMEVNAAKHVLNAYGARGLTFLKHGDDEEEVAKRARQANYEFKRKQVTEYNTRNEQRRHMGLGFIMPSKQIRAYAEELGLQLMEPFQTKEKTSGNESEIDELRLENKELKLKVDKMMAMLESLAAKEEPHIKRRREVMSDGNVQ